MFGDTPMHVTYSKSNHFMVCLHSSRVVLLALSRVTTVLQRARRKQEQGLRVRTLTLQCGVE